MRSNYKCSQCLSLFVKIKITQSTLKVWRFFWICILKIGGIFIHTGFFTTHHPPPPPLTIKSHMPFICKMLKNKFYDLVYTLQTINCPLYIKCWKINFMIWYIPYRQLTGPPHFSQLQRLIVGYLMCPVLSSTFLWGRVWSSKKTSCSL